MNTQPYINFDIRIGLPNGDIYPVHVLDSPAGRTPNPALQSLEPVNDTNNPLQLKDLLEYFKELVADDNDIINLGKILYKFLFPEQIKDLYNKTIGTDNKNVRIRISWDELLYQLENIPWECMHDGNSYLAFNPHISIVKWCQSREPQLIKPSEHVKVLAVAASPSNMESLGVEKELNYVKNILDSLPRIRLSTQNEINRELLTELLQNHQPHILHFAGHAKNDLEGASLILQDRNGTADAFTGNDILSIANASLQLIILNACNTGNATTSSLSLAHNLTKTGVPAVISMQSEVPDELAISFIKEFYKHIVEGDSIDTAMYKTRVFLHTAKAERARWIIPSLFIGTSNTLTLATTPYLPYGNSRPTEPVRQFNQDGLLPPKLAYNTKNIRGSDIDEIAKKLNECKYENPSSSIVVLHGTPRIGKINLALEFAHLYSPYFHAICWVKKDEIQNINANIGKYKAVWKTLDANQEQPVKESLIVIDGYNKAIDDVQPIFDHRNGALVLVISEVPIVSKDFLGVTFKNIEIKELTRNQILSLCEVLWHLPPLPKEIFPLGSFESLFVQAGGSPQLYKDIIDYYKEKGIKDGKHLQDIIEEIIAQEWNHEAISKSQEGLKYQYSRLFDDIIGVNFNPNELKTFLVFVANSQINVSLQHFDFISAVIEIEATRIKDILHSTTKHAVLFYNDAQESYEMPKDIRRYITKQEKDIFDIWVLKYAEKSQDLLDIIIEIEDENLAEKFAHFLHEYITPKLEHNLKSAEYFIAFGEYLSSLQNLESLVDSYCDKSLESLAVLAQAETIEIQLNIIGRILALKSKGKADISEIIERGKQIIPQEKDKNKSIKLYNLFANSLREANQVDLATDYYYKADELQNELIDDYKKNRFQSLRSLADIVRDSDLQKALNYTKQYLDISQSMWGENDDRVLRLMERFVNDLNDAGEIDWAKTYYKTLALNGRTDAIDRLINFLEKEEIDLSYSDLQKIADTCYENGLFDKANYYYRCAISKHSSLIKDNELHLAITYNNFGQLLYLSDKIEDAEKCYEKVLEIRRAYLGEDDLHVANVLSNLGELMQATGRIKEAKNYLNQALNIYQTIEGQESIYVGNVLSKLGSCFGETNEHEEAVGYIKKALDIYASSEQPNLVVNELNNLENLGLSLKEQNRFEEAKVYFKQVIKFCLQNFGVQNPTTIRAQTNLASLLEILGDWSSAQKYYKDALSSSEQMFLDEPNLDIAILHHNLSQVFVKTKQLNIALIHAQKSYDIRGQILEKDHPDVNKSSIHLDQIKLQLKDSGLLEKQEKLLELFVEIQTNMPALIPQLDEYDHEDLPNYIASARKELDRQRLPKVVKELRDARDIVRKHKAIAPALLAKIEQAIALADK